MNEHIITDWANDQQPAPRRPGLCLAVVVMFVLGLVAVGMLIGGLVA